jgi:tetratricopeptide (TPR) repeat protein
MAMHDFNLLEKRAKTLVDQDRFPDAIKIYLLMADGDPSLDGDYLGMRIGECYEKIGDLHAAKYWFGRAVEENPEITEYVQARRRLESVTIDDLV